MKSIYQIYESVILEAMSLEEIFKKFYEKELKDYDRFLEINSIDPTSSKDKKGKYLDWLIRKAFKNSFPLTFFEDGYKIKEDLILFDKNQRQMGKQISQINDYKELSKIVREFREKKEKGEIDLSRSEIKKDANKIFEDNVWLIVVPKTESAAKYYGAHTQGGVLLLMMNIINSIIIINKVHYTLL